MRLLVHLILFLEAVQNSNCLLEETCSKDDKICHERAKAKRAKITEGLNDQVFDKKTSPDGKTQRSKVEEAVIAKLKEVTFRVIGKECSNTTGTCFDVIDQYAPYNDWEVNRIVRRAPEKPKDDFVMMSLATLIKPWPVNWSTFDTKKWKVRKNAVLVAQHRFLTAAAFATKSIPKEDDGKIYNALLLGGAGGIISNHLSTYPHVNVTIIELEPALKVLAEKWFEVEETNMQRYIIADAEIYIQQAAKRGEKYDTIIIDACHNVISYITCPINALLQKRTIALMKDLLTETGTLALNTLAVEQNQAHFKDVQDRYLEEFPTCFYFPDSADLADGEVLICTKKKSPVPKDTPAILKRFRKAMLFELDFYYHWDENASKY